MATKKDYEALMNIALVAIHSLDPEVKANDYMSHPNEYHVITPKAGSIVFMLDTDKPENKRGEAASISIFSRFENPQSARALGFDCNQFSGKWNHHFLWSRSHITSVVEELKARGM